MLKTRITEILGIKYPIIQGGMRLVSCAELAAAVSNAGGLGILASTNFGSSEDLRREVLKTKELTDKPFGVNISLFPAVKKLPNDEFIDVIIEERVAAVETSGIKSPEEFIPRLHAAGVKVIHKTATVRHACKGEQVGVDALAVVGIENGGNVGMEDVTTLVLVPKTVQAVRAPVIAGGGICDARGFVAALALGAEGVLIGTRFMATKESPAHPKFKEWMLRSQENETALVQRSIRNTHRTLKNKAVEKTLELEARGAPLEELLPWISGDNNRRVVIDGELDAGMAYCGQVVGLINNLPTVKEVIDDLISGALAIGERLSAMGVF
jgi:nitronate monooxygenase